MSIDEVSPERFVNLFRHYYDALAPDFNSFSGSRVQQDRSRMVAALQLVLLDMASRDSAYHHDDYFAKPGEAEWGC